MKGNWPLNRVKLHKALLELLRHPEVHLTYSPLVKDGARGEWDDIFPPTNIRIKVDANDGEHVKKVVHELLHVVLYGVTLGRLDNTLDEVVVDAMTSYIMLHINKSKTRLATWLDLIDDKIKEGTEPIPYEERMIRSKDKD